MRRFRLHSVSPSLLTALVLAGGCVDEILPFASPTMSGVVMEVGTSENLSVHLSSAVVDPASGTVTGESVRLEAGTSIKSRLSGNSSSWDLETGVVQFEGAVEFSHGELKVSCVRLSGVFSNELLATATAEGRVEVQKGDVRATGARAEWDGRNGSLKLTGQPMVWDVGRTLQGAEITIFVDERRLECSNCTVVIAPVKLNED